MGAVT